MASDDPNLTDQPPDFKAFADTLATSLASPGYISRLWSGASSAFTELFTGLVAIVLTGAARFGAFLAEQLAEAEDKSQPGFQRLAEVAIKDMFGVNVSGKLTAARNSGGNTAAASAIGDALLHAFAGQAVGSGAGGALVPSDQPAKVFLSAMAQMALEGWLEGWIVEAMSIGQLETFGDLDDTMSHVLGLGRASAAVHGPLVRHLIVTPLEWKINKEHRPALLSESLAVRQFLRGKWTRAQLDEELARQGWSPERIEAHIGAQQRKPTLEHAMMLKRVGILTRDAVEQQLVDDGYERTIAGTIISAHEWTRLEAIDQAPLAALKRAFVNRDIPFTQLQSAVTTIINDATEAAFWLSSANVERDLNVRHLSHAEIRDAVKVLAVPMVEYRRWLEREGYPESEAFTLELLLRADIDKETDIEKHRAKQEADRAAEKKARADAAALRKADVDAQRALARRGAESDLERAVVRGQIPIARLDEVLSARYDADTVAILVGLVEGDRQTYLDEQNRRAEALKRAETRGIDVGALDSAVMTNMLTLQEFRARLTMLRFSDADADLLTATLGARKADADAARAKRDAAEAEAKRRKIDLGRVEQLVVRGVHSLAEYDALLASWGFDEGSRVAMRELVQLKIDDAAAAAAERRAAEERLKNKGLSLEQFTRAVILSTKTEDDYARFLIAEHFTADAQIVLLAQLRADKAEADAARRKRAEAEAASQARAVPLSTLARAARLGMVSPTVYQARLEREHFTPDDIAVELQLLVTEIADTQAARQRRDELDAASAAREGLSLAQVERAVKTGVSSIEDYRARAASLYPPADVQVLVDVLAAELQTLADARARHAQIQAELGTRDLSLTQLEAAVKAGLKTLDDYVAGVQALGYDADDAALLATLLLDELTAGTEAP